jgi:hypothetical protein
VEDTTSVISQGGSGMVASKKVRFTAEPNMSESKMSVTARPINNKGSIKGCSLLSIVSWCGFIAGTSALDCFSHFFSSK